MSAVTIVSGHDVVEYPTRAASPLSQIGLRSSVFIVPQRRILTSQMTLFFRKRAGRRRLPFRIASCLELSAPRLQERCMHTYRAGDPRETLATVGYSRDRVALEFKTERSAFFSHETSWSDLLPTRYECRGNRYKRIGTFSGVSKISIDASPTLHYPPNSRQYAP